MKKMKKTLTAAFLASSILVTTVPFINSEIPQAFAASTQQTDKVISYAKSLKGAPYKDGGTTKKGFDASGYVQHVYQKFDTVLPRAAKDMFSGGQKATSLQPGDLVFYDTKNKTKKEANYVGIYIGNQQFISVTVKKGVSIQSMKDSYWKAKYMGAKKAPFIGNEFSLNEVKTGDVISGMKINSILLANNTPELPSHIVFEGKATVSGTISINTHSADRFSFIPDQASLKKLPVMKNNKGKALITFEDQEAAKKLLGKQKDKQKVTITIEKYVISFKENEVWKTAQIVHLMK